MALVTKNFTLNVTPGAMPPTVHVSEYDIGRTYAVQLLDENGSAYEIPTGTTVTVEGTLNGTVGFTTSATIDGNQISFALTESMTAYSGKAWCKIKLTQNSQPIQTCAFILAVDRAGVEAGTVIGADGFEQQIRGAVDESVAEYLNDFAIDDDVVRDAVDDYLDENGIDTESITTATTDWLSDNVTPVGSAVVVDSSLSIAGAAADAKVTGDKLKSAESWGIRGAAPSVVWEQGGIVNGVESTDATRIRTGFIYMPKGSFIQVFPTTANLASISYYDKDRVFRSATDWSPTSYYILAGDDQYIRIAQRKMQAGTDITVSENAIDIFGTSSLTRSFEILRSSTEVISGESFEWVNGYLENGKQTYISNRICNKNPILVASGTMINVSLAANQMALYYLIDTETLTPLSSPPGWITANFTIDIPKDCIFNIAFAFGNSSAITPTDRNSTVVITPPFAADLIHGVTEKVTNFEQGALSTDGVTETDSPTRARTAEPVFVPEGSTIEILLNGKFIVYWYLLDENETKYAGASAWTYENVILHVNKDSYFNAVFAQPGAQAAITPSDLAALEINIYSPLSSAVRNVAKAGKYGYTGERILLGSHTFDVEDFIELSRQPSVCNGSAIWGNYIVVADTNGTSFSVYQKDGTYISSVDISSMVTSDFHGNTLVFARQLHTGNEQFPYLYANAFYGDQKIYVFDVRLTGGTLSVSVVQTIDISGLSSSITGAGFADFAIDFDHNELLLIRYAISDTFQAVAGNYTKISTFDLPSPAVGNVALSDSGIKNTNTLYDLIYARQSCVFHNGKLFMLAGSTYKSWLFAISDGQIVSKVYLSDALEQLEPEGLMITEDGLLILPRATSTIYRLLFR